MGCAWGPVQTSYTVSINPELEVRREEEERRREEERREEERRAAERRAELTERARGLSDELRETAGLWQEARDRHGEDFPAWSHGDAPQGLARMTDNDALESVVEDLARRAARAQSEYARQSALFNARASLQEAAEFQAAAARAAAESAAQEKAEREERERLRCEEEVARLLETLSEDASRQHRTAVVERARETVDSALSPRRRALLGQLRLDIQRANEEGRSRRRMVEQVEQWRQRLLGLEGPEVEQLDATLRQVADGQATLPPGVSQRVEEVVARATAAADRDYALRVITEELEKLDYVVESGPEADQAEAPEILLRKAEMEDDYLVSLQAEADEPILNTQVVREASDSDTPNPRSADREESDHDTERMWFQDFATALAASGRRGVEGRVVERVEAGREPVKTVAPLKSKSESRPKRNRRRTDRLRSRAHR